MKNLFLHESEKYSPLQLKWNNELHVEDGRTIALRSYLNIYITSEDPPEKGNYVINIKTNEVYKVFNINEGMPVNNKGNRSLFTKKIILTTDLSIIKDGVKEISQDFLIEFIRNPTCESVKIKKLLSNSGNCFYGYEVAIPEEVKEGGQPNQRNRQYYGNG